MYPQQVLFKRAEANLAAIPQDPFVKYDTKHSGFFEFHSMSYDVFVVAAAGGVLFCLGSLFVG